MKNDIVVTRKQMSQCIKHHSAANLGGWQAQGIKNAVVALRRKGKHAESLEPAPEKEL